MSNRWGFLCFILSSWSTTLEQKLSISFVEDNEFIIYRWFKSPCHAGIANSPLYFFIGCPDYWKRFNTSLYAIFFRAKPWEHAEGFCRSMDAHLVKIETRAEGVNIGSLINELNSSKVHWIGLTDIEVENLWKWSDGSSLGPHRPWAGRKTPANFTPSDCVGLYGIPWHLIDCSRKQKFICEKKDWGSLKNIPSPSWLTLRVT